MDFEILINSFNFTYKNQNSKLLRIRITIKIEKKLINSHIIIPPPKLIVPNIFFLEIRNGLAARNQGAITLKIAAFDSVV